MDPEFLIDMVCFQKNYAVTNCMPPIRGYLVSPCASHRKPMSSFQTTSSVAKKNNLVDCARRNKLGTSHDRAQLSTADQPSTAGHSRVQPRTADQPSEPCSHQDRKAARLLVQAFFFSFVLGVLTPISESCTVIFFKTVSTCKQFS